MADKLDGVAITANSVPSNRIQTGSITSTQLQTSLYNTIVNATHPKIRSLTYPGDDTAANTGGSQTVIINGTGFGTNVAVYINGNSVPSVTVSNANSVSFSTPALSAATYPLYLINTDDGATAILIPGIQYSGTPAWVTTSPLADQQAAAAWSISLSATGDSPIVYSLQAGSTLPAGITLAANGLISGTMSSPPATDTTYNFTVVAIDPQNQDASKAFSVSVTVTVDTQFNYNVLLLHADGTNNGNNHAFLDSSNNNFAITRNGNASQGSFSPFSPTGWSMHQTDINGTYPSFTTSVGSAFQFTGDFTVEGWVYPVSYSGTGDTSLWVTYDNVNYFALNYDGSGNYNIYLNSGSPTSTFSSGIALNQWNHVAMVRSGSTVTLYTNGISRGTISNSSTLGHATPSLARIGGGAASNVRYVSNVRIVKGTAVYTANFTPPTTPLTAVANTQLLTCQSNRFVDSSNNNFTATLTGSPSIQAFSPFASTTAYSTSSHGGSAYFDGVGDYLTVPTGYLTNIGTGNFTVEGWWNFSDFTTRTTYFQRCWSFGTGLANDVTLNVDNSGNLVFRINDVAIVTQSSGAMALNTWNHIAVVRSSGTVTIYLNGVSVGSAANSSNISTQATSPFYVGSEAGGTGGYFIGYQSNLRVTNTAVYTSAFTPPTAPLTAISNTQILLSCTNGQIFDSTAKNVLETVSGAKVNTSIYKYGTGSVAFNGTSDYLSIPYTQNQNFGTGDFTVEGWFYLNSLSASYYVLGGTWSSATSDEWLIQIQNNGSLRFLTTADTNFYATGIITTGKWYHFAASRNSGTIKTYINGTAISTVTNANTIGSVSKTMFIGQQSGGNWYWNGYVDDFRISKGLGRYPYNFTPPTKAFADKGGTDSSTSDTYFPYTALLLPGNGTNNANNQAFVDSSTNNFAITRNGNATQGTFSPFSQTGWSTFFASGNYLNAASNAAFAPGTGDFTVEAWINHTSAYTTYNYILGVAVTGGLVFYILGGVLVVRAYNVGDQLTSTYSPPLNQWTHVAAVRSGTTLTIYANGVAVASTTNSYNFVQGAAYIGNDGTNAAPWYGYISNLRMVKGTAVYTSNFTPSTSALTAIANTSLLTCQSNRFVDNSTNIFALTVTGSPSVQAFSPFSPSAVYAVADNGASAYFDGNSDSLTLTPNTNLDLTGAYTIEFWMYLNSIALDTQHPSIITFPSSYQIYVNATNLYVALYNGFADVRASASNSITTNQWYHIAFSRNSSNTLSLYVNGTRVSTGTAAGTIGSSSGTLRLMSFDGSGGDANGYLSNLRIVKGTAVYDPALTTITVPTAPLTAISNTQLLLSCTNAGITDATGKNVLETVGDAKISTTQSKFGGSSVFFNGTGSWLSGSPTDLTNLGSGDFTIEAWLYRTASGAASDSGIVSRGAASTLNGFAFAYTSANVLTFNFNYSGAIVTGATAIPINTWTHVAVTRYGTTFRLFVNGVVDATATSSNSQTTNASDVVYVGRSSYDSGRIMTGYLDDVRITKGIARYTSNFTPPASALLAK